MSKYTVTLNEYIASELYNEGKREFYNFGQLTMNDDRYAFIKKMMKFDDDVKQIVDKRFFLDFKLEDSKADENFKKTFLMKFMNREIGRQTIEAFASEVLYVLFSHEEYINIVFSDEVFKYLNNHVTNNAEDIGTQDNTESSNDNTNDNQFGGKKTSRHHANSTLPQNEVTLNVKDDELDFADTYDVDKNEDEDFNIRTTENEASKNANQNTTNNHESLSKTFNLYSLNELYDMKNKVMKEFDKNCFMQIW